MTELSWSWSFPSELWFFHRVSFHISFCAWSLQCSLCFPLLEYPGALWSRQRLRGSSFTSHAQWNRRRLRLAHLPKYKWMDKSSHRNHKRGTPNYKKMNNRRSEQESLLLYLLHRYTRPSPRCSWPQLARTHLGSFIQGILQAFGTGQIGVDAAIDYSYLREKRLRCFARYHVSHHRKTGC